MNRRYCIVGIGGFGRETLTCLVDSMNAKNENPKSRIVFMVDDEFYKVPILKGYEVIPTSKFNSEKYEVVIGIGDPLKRRKVVESLPVETVYGNIIHPTVVISEWVEISEGTIITAGCVLTCDIKIGKHAHFNLLSTVGHD
ncbi:MAG: hypothetical protein LH629_15230, partial [Ignavibacteria bacterium]|nr:hypothetical protein [Ignavibacteria bacterium]